MMRKNLLKSLLVTLAILFSLGAMAYDVEVGGIYYRLDVDSQTAIVTFGDSKYFGDVDIPDSFEHDGVAYSVTGIGHSAFYDCSGLTAIRIPNSVTSIENAAFANCGGLTAIVIPSRVVSIGDYAFQGCIGLTTVTIPGCVTSIGQSAFIGCGGLKAIVVEPENAVYDSRDNCNAIVEKASNTLIVGCQNTVIPNSVACIGKCAFSYCVALATITIPNSVTSIGDSAFYGCSGLTSVVSEIENPFTFGMIAFYGISSDCVLTVPSGTKDAYVAKRWTVNVFKGGIVEAEPKKCETPTITLCANGKLKVECATESATCVTSITVSSSEEMIDLNGDFVVCQVNSYAPAEGYQDSDVATTTFRWKKTEGDLNGDGVVNISDVTMLVNKILEK